MLDDDQKGSPQAKLPIVEPSDVERATIISFEEIESEMKKIKTDLNGMDCI